MIGSQLVERGRGRCQYMYGTYRRTGTVPCSWRESRPCWTRRLTHAPGRSTAGYPPPGQGSWQNGIPFKYSCLTTASGSVIPGSRGSRLRLSWYVVAFNLKLDSFLVSAAVLRSLRRSRLEPPLLGWSRSRFFCWPEPPGTGCIILASKKGKPCCCDKTWLKISL